jgi:hypothetical protein
MFRGLKAILRHTDDPTSRSREWRCRPTLSGSASFLEDRVLLSGAGAKAHAAEVAHPAAQNLANTHAGQVVTGLYESILGTNPTSAQLTSWVHKLRSGVSSKVLRKDLLATARSEQLQASAAGVVAIDVSSDTTTSTLSIMGSSSTTTGSSTAATSATTNNSLPPVSDSAIFIGHNVQPILNLGTFRAGFVVGSSSGSATGGTTTTGSTSLTSGLSSLSTSTSGLTTSGSSSLQSLLSSLSTSTSGLTTSGSTPLQSLLSTGTVPTPGLTTTTGTISSSLGQLGLSQLGLSQSSLSQLSVTPALSVSSTAPDAPTTGLTIAPSTGLTIAPTTGLTIAPTTGLTIAPTTGLTVAPSSNLI